MKDRNPVVALLLVAALLTVGTAAAQEPGAAAPRDPLAPFERLVGGQWHLEGSYHELEWGVGRRSVRSRSYLMVGGVPKLVSEGSWYWHPASKQIRGVVTAIDMPVVFFEYTTRFEAGRMVHDLVAYDAQGAPSAYVERWDFIDDAHYEWKLFARTEGGLQEAMGGTYTRRLP